MNTRNDSPEASLYKRIDDYDAIAAVIDDLPYERYDYLYAVDELEPWVDRVKAVAAKAEDTYAVTKNHYVGKATGQCARDLLDSKRRTRADTSDPR